MLNTEMSLRPARPSETKPAKILVVDDNPGLREYVSQFLIAQNFDVETACDGFQMTKQMKRAKFDLIVLDSIMPGENGLSICRRVSEQEGPPIIMLSARGEDKDRIYGLDQGAEDYVAKPFNPDELVARIRAVLRRLTGVKAIDGSNIVDFLGWSLDISKRRMTSPADISFNLSNTEFDLLSVFLDNRGQVLSREDIQKHMADLREDNVDCALDALISRFRRKLTNANPLMAGAGELISTRYGAGYILCDDETGG